jgi:hypothetical protein
MLSSGLRIWIALLGAISGVIHLIVLNVRLMSMGFNIDVPFTLNGIGFLTLSALALWRPSFLRGWESLYRWAFIGFTAITIVAWTILGDKADILGWATTVLEVVLLVLLVMDGRRRSVA